MHLQELLAGYLVLVNLIGFVLVFADKKKAVKHQWRIPEKIFFLLSLFGGGIGIFTGMFRYHHKTKHWSFLIGIPASTVLFYGALISLLIRHFR